MSSEKIAPVAPVVPVEPTPPTAPVEKSVKNFAIYYSWPSAINFADFANNIADIATFFNQYSLVVFGGGLEDPGHGDHANTIAIIALMKGQAGAYGYVSIGATFSESLADLKARVDKWDTLVDVDGIFLDEFGFDFRLTGQTDAQVRTRQKAIVDYVHSLGLKVFVNAFDPDDCFTKEPGDPIVWQAGDKYLYESYIFSFAPRETFTAYRSKVAKLQTAKVATGVEMFAISTTAAPNSAFVQADYDYMILSAAADGLDGISWGTDLFSASSSLMPFRGNTSLLKKLEPADTTIDTVGEALTFTHPTGKFLLDYATPAFTLTP